MNKHFFKRRLLTAVLLLGALGINTSDVLRELTSTVAQPDQTRRRR